MHIEEYRNYCLSKNWVTEEFPFDETTLVFKVGGKMFAFGNVDTFEFVNLKCDPERAIELREIYNGVKPGYYASKKHWNSVYTSSDVPDDLFRELIDNSYELVFNSLTKKKQNELQAG